MKEGMAMLKDLLRYSMQLAMLNQLRDRELVTEEEYYEIKKRLMEDYNIISEFMN